MADLSPARVQALKDRPLRDFGYGFVGVSMSMDERDDLLAALEAQGQTIARLTAERTWRPMSEAPMDGTRILIARDDGDDVGVHGAVEVTEFCVSPRSHFEPTDNGLFKKVDDEPYKFWNGNGHRATHWQPMPDPPVAADAPDAKEPRV